MSAPSAPPLVVAGDDRRALVKMAHSQCSPHRVAVQAQALLWAADGEANEEIARRCDVDADTIRRWRRRFEQQGVDGVGVIAKGRGRKPWLPDGTIAEIVRMTLEESPSDTSTHWTTRTLARRIGVGKDTVARVWREREIKPWKAGTLDLPDDPYVGAALVDVVGLYLSPPEKVAVFSFDGTARTHAPNCTRSSRPIECGQDGTAAPDHVRLGPRGILGTSSVATVGTRHAEHGRTSSPDRGQILTFFKLIDAQLPRSLEVRVVLDNLAAHMTPEITRWLDHAQRVRWHLHFVPASSSWSILVERWFDELAGRPSQPGELPNVDAVLSALEGWSELCGDRRVPFVWHTAEGGTVQRTGLGRTAPRQNRSGARS